MTKNIIIGILVVLCAVLAVHAQIQTVEVVRMEKIAQKVTEQAKRTEAMADANAQEARHQQVLAEAAYADCHKKKK